MTKPEIAALVLASLALALIVIGSVLWVIGETVEHFSP
jgi:hypothetical protein